VAALAYIVVGDQAPAWWRIRMQGEEVVELKRMIQYEPTRCVGGLDAWG